MQHLDRIMLIAVSFFCSLCWSVFTSHPEIGCSVVKKVAQYMADVLEDSRDKVQENLLANGGNLCLHNQGASQKNKSICFTAIKVYKNGY